MTPAASIYNTTQPVPSLIDLLYRAKNHNIAINGRIIPIKAKPVRAASLLNLRFADVESVLHISECLYQLFVVGDYPVSFNCFL